MNEKTKKVLSELKSIDEAIIVNKFNVGYMVEISGRDVEDDYQTIKVICDTLDDVVEVLRGTDIIPKC